MADLVAEKGVIAGHYRQGASGLSPEVETGSGVESLIDRRGLVRLIGIRIRHFDEAGMDQDDESVKPVEKTPREQLGSFVRLCGQRGTARHVARCQRDLDPRKQRAIAKIQVPIGVVSPVVEHRTT
jgi:hypothetical protein